MIICFGVCMSFQGLHTEGDVEILARTGHGHGLKEESSVLKGFLLVDAVYKKDGRQLQNYEAVKVWLLSLCTYMYCMYGMCMCACVHVVYAHA